MTERFYLWYPQRGRNLERLKENVQKYHREQLRQFEKTFHYKAQQEHFIHEIFSSDLSLLTYQETSQTFLAARGETLLLLLRYHAFSPERALEYSIPMPDRSLPFYMAYLDDRYSNGVVKTEVPEDTVKVTLHLELLEGMLATKGFPQVTLEKNFAKGTIVLGNESTTVRLPYAGYRALDDRRVVLDAKQFLGMIQGLHDQEPAIVSLRP